MAISNAERIGKSLDILKQGLLPFVEREMKHKYGDQWPIRAAESFLNDAEWNKKRLEGELDVQALLSIMWTNWELVFKRILGPAERSLIAEIRQVRNNWAHQQAFGTDDAYRGIDSIHRLLLSISSPEALTIDKQKQELLRVKYEEQVRNEQRKMASHGIDGQPKPGLRPWREIMTPHHDVASGKFQQAEFAVDLWQIHRGEGSTEYKDPIEFFRRTYITQGIEQLLSLAIKRLSGVACDPVVQLQTNFGGGKTHSMLALYHLFSGTKINSLPGMDKVIAKHELKESKAKVNRAVLVGTYISPGQASKKDDGTVVHTLWGELAYQLGGKAGYQMIADSDKNGTNPGNALKELFNKFSPCLVLIDEWVAYARQLYETSGLPAGTLDTHFTFAQSLSECAKTAKDTLLVVSIPASDAEIGGEGGRIALKGLTKAIGRVEAPWRPATPDESFEIVRRRLFQDIVDPNSFTSRDAVVKAFAQQYRDQKNEYPSECAESEYEKRMKAAYPIHPSLFDALYEDWSTLDKFQRTRGVLRLMSAVIHRLWLQEDKSLMIMPAHVPLEDLSVQPELTRYLDDEAQWPPIISRDVDGPDSVPFGLDSANPALGRYSASRRVSRSIFMHTAPHSGAGAQERGISEKQIRVACVQPGETAGTFSDALRRLTTNLTHLYESDGQYYYSLKANVTRIARDRAEHVEQHVVSEKMVEKVKLLTGKNHSFTKIYVLPQNPSEVPDDQSARLAILGPEAAHSSKSHDATTASYVMNFLNQRGSGARKFRNTLVFLVPDAAKIKDLEGGIKILKAWESVQEDSEKGILDLSASQKKTMEAKLKESNGTVDARIKETFIWLVQPIHNDSGEIKLEESRIQLGSEGLADRVSKKMEDDRSLLKSIAPVILKNELDNHLWKDEEHISVKRLWECFCSYPYLMRLRDEQVLTDCIIRGVNQPVWAEFFAYADGYDEKAKRYVNLQYGKSIQVELNGASILVKPNAARKQIDLESGGNGEGAQPVNMETWRTNAKAGTGQAPITIKSGKPSRFYGSTTIEPDRLGSEARKIAEEVIQHLAALVGANVEVTIEIKATVPRGVDEKTVRTVTENCKALKVSGGFEED